jgi:branched-chain amino acid transport system ATP-binding protein
MTALLEVDDVAVHFGGVKALDGATLKVEKGELLGLIGPNGSGKSTMLGVISRLTHLTSGSLSAGGQDYTTAGAHQVSSFGIARTFQTVRLLSTLNVLQNVMLGAEVDAVRRGPMINWLLLPARRTQAKVGRAAAEGALERVGMREFAGASPLDLPYGRQRKVEIARALAGNPDLLLLDEPVAGMTHFEREEVGDLLVALNREGLAQVLVEHDLAMIHKVCTRVVALNFGKVIAQGTAAEVSADPLVREAYLGKSAAADPQMATTGVTR